MGLVSYDIEIGKKSEKGEIQLWQKKYWSYLQVFKEAAILIYLQMSAFEKAYNGLQGWVDCFEKASLKGMVGGSGIDAANTAAGHVDVMKKAYELGKKLRVWKEYCYLVCVY